MDIFSSIFSSGTTTTAVSPITVLSCIGAALVIGIFLKWKKIKKTLANYFRLCYTTYRCRWAIAKR